MLFTTKYRKSVQNANKVRLLFILLGLGLHLCLQSQQTTLTVKATRITISEGTTLYVNGNVEVTENRGGVGGYDNICNNGTLIITDTLINNVDSLFVVSSNPKLINDGLSTAATYGLLRFKDFDYPVIKGSPSIFISKLSLDNNKLNLKTNIRVLDQITLNGGNIYLGGNHLQMFDMQKGVKMYEPGGLNGFESYDSRIYDDSIGTIIAYKYVPKQNEGEYLFPANLGFGISSRKGYDYVKFTRYHYSDTNVTTGSIPIFFEIDTGSEDICLGHEGFIKQYYFQQHITSSPIN